MTVGSILPPLTGLPKICRLSTDGKLFHLKRKFSTNLYLLLFLVRRLLSYSYVFVQSCFDFGFHVNGPGLSV